MTKIIIIASGKGGTGKTSLAAGLGAALAAREHQVLVIDGDSGLRNPLLFRFLSYRKK